MQLPACRPERDRQQRTITVDGYEVLKVNNYNAQAGGISAWEETGGEARMGIQMLRSKTAAVLLQDAVDLGDCRACKDSIAASRVCLDA
jgi:hypothetical protein